jgi:hypothetical protein
MTRRQKLTLTGVIAAVLIAAAIALKMVRTGSLNTLLLEPVSFTAAVVRNDSDPAKQAPVPNVTVIATGGQTPVVAKSDSSGLVRLTLQQGVYGDHLITLKFQHSDYQPFEMTLKTPNDELFVVRMLPLPIAPSKTPAAKLPAKMVHIKKDDVRVRYTFKDQAMTNVGTLAKQFDVMNKGNVPCDKHPPCSPDGKWKATLNSLSLDADQGNVFRNVRVSCIAGPCPFTKIDTDDLSLPTRKLKVNVLSWSDTTSFLIEADVTRTKPTSSVRYLYPYIIDRSMDFTLPHGSEGLSIEASVDGQPIVFPLGPDLILTWATCSIETEPSGDNIYRCQLKPGYEF